MSSLGKNMLQELNGLSKLGFKFLLEDFNFEYCSLERFLNLPIDFIKIDLSVISNISTANKTITMIAESVLMILNKLNSTVIVEGIETKEQLNFILSQDCLHGQGYFLAKPMSLTNLINHL